jgi:hypothetical protein
VREERSVFLERRAAGGAVGNDDVDGCGLEQRDVVTGLRLDQVSAYTRKVAPTQQWWLDFLRRAGSAGRGNRTVVDSREGREVMTIDREAFAALLAHDFAGNIRELENLLEGAASLSRAGVIRLEDLQWLPSRAAEETADAVAPADGEVPDLRALEDRHIRRVLKLAGGNKSRAARMLGISRRTLYRKKTLGR